MSRYTYRAVNNAGKFMTGALDAQSLDHANELVGARGLAALEVAPETEGDRAHRMSKWLLRMHAVHAEELILFTKQLATMLRAGIPVLRVLEILETQTENPRLITICADLSGEIRSGSNLHRAMQRHPEVFSPLYVSMVQAGESSGALPQILQRLIYVISHENKVRSDVRSVMQYPIIVLVCLVTAFVILMTMVIPRFAVVYTRSEVALPLPTRICLVISDFLRNEWGVLVLALAAVAAGLYLVVRTEKGRYWRDRMFLHLPLIGPLVVKASLSRLASIFSIMQATGVGILDALQMLAHTVGNSAISRELLQVQTRLQEGHGIARPLMSARYFTPMFVNMVAIGEETGNLDEMLKEISLHYDAEVEYATRRLTTAMGPILIVALAAMVGFFALAVYLPMWDLARVVTQSI